MTMLRIILILIFILNLLPGHLVIGELYQIIIALRDHDLMNLKSAFLKSLITSTGI